MCPEGDGHSADLTSSRILRKDEVMKSRKQTGKVCLLIGAVVVGLASGADKLPSSQTSAAFGNLVSGVADVAFLHGQLYALLSGAGCSHGLTGTNNGIIRIHRDGTWDMVANLSVFQKAHPT